MGSILPIIHYTSLHWWKLLHPLAHHCQRHPKSAEPIAAFADILLARHQHSSPALGRKDCATNQKKVCKRGHRTSNSQQCSECLGVIASVCLNKTQQTNHVTARDIASIGLDRFCSTIEICPEMHTTTIMAKMPRSVALRLSKIEKVARKLSKITLKLLFEKYILLICY